MCSGTLGNEFTYFRFYSLKIDHLIFTLVVRYTTLRYFVEWVGGRGKQNSLSSFFLNTIQIL